MASWGGSARLSQLVTDVQTSPESRKAVGPVPRAARAASRERGRPGEAGLHSADEEEEEDIIRLSADEEEL